MTSPATLVKSSVLVVDGYGVRIAVERGHLLIQDGVASDRREYRIPRVAPDARRLVVLGHAGTISLDALRWLHDVGVAFVHIDHDGTLVTVGTTKALDDVRVRRGQAVANANGVGLAVAKELIGQKIAGQERVATRLESMHAVRWLREAGMLVQDVQSVDDLRFVESKAAAAYWDAWRDVPAHFTPRDARKVPAHWLTFDSRRSPLSRSPRKASNPANALLNYLYAVLEAEARIALLRVGADAGMGVLHVDSSRRDSFACDVMEAVRPDVDEYALNLLRRHTFNRADFFETPDGNCRIMPNIARPLAQTAPRWAKRLAPIAEHVAAAFAAGAELPQVGQLASSSTLPKRFRTPLTQRNRSQARPVARQSVADPARLSSRCRGCGASLGSLNRAHCETCLERQRVHASTLARKALRADRVDGHDGRASAETRTKHRQDATRQQREIAQWESVHGATHDAARYENEIAPSLRNVPVRVLMDATGLGVIYCRQIRLGKRVPHPRHWEALGSVAREHGQSVPARWDTAFYLREVAPNLVRFTPQQIAEASGLSVPYCKRVRRGLQLPRRHHWPSLFDLVSR